MSESGTQHGREWNSSAYHRVSDPQFGWGLKLIEGLQLRGGETVLDAGCGTGRLTAELLKRLPAGQVIAVDLSENMIGTAREFLRPQFGERVRFVQSDLTALTLVEAVDGVFSAATFHWVQDRARMFERLCVALRPQGWLVAQAGGGHSLSRYWELVEAVTAREPYAEYLREFKKQQSYLDPEVTGEQMRAAGFEDVEISLRDAPVQFPDKAAFREFIRTVNMKNHLERLPTELGERLLDDVAEASARSENALTLDYARLNIRGSKRGRR